MIWALTLLVAVIPAVLLLLGVRWVADRLEPGYGTAAAVTLGIATIVMTFASEYFSHVIAAALGFAAFLVLMRERDGAPSTGRGGSGGDGRARRDLRVPGGPGRARPLQHLHHTTGDLADLTRHARAEGDHVTTVDGHRFTITQVERVEGAVARQQHHADAGGMDQEATLTTERGS